MRTRLLILLSTMLLLQACTRAFVPEKYELDATAIAQFDVKGEASVSNAQPSTANYTVFTGGGSKLTSDLHSLTSSMVLQASQELARHQHAVGAGNAKTLELKIESLVSEYAGFHWNSTLHFQAKLGDGQVVELTTEHTSGWSVQQDLNGCIADSVAALFKDPKVLAYLAQ
jgi:hypothetical protein